MNVWWSQKDNEFEISSASPPLWSDLINDLNFSKESSELLAPRFNEKNLLHPGTNITFYHNRSK